MPEFNNETMQETMLRAGVSPRDLSTIMVCHYTTLYTFFQTGKGRRLTLFSFQRIQDFLEDGITKGFFPLEGRPHPEKRRSIIKATFDKWLSDKNSIPSRTVAV